MKIIITENKLDRVISKWLTKKYSEMDIYDHDNQPWCLYLDKNGEIIFLYHYKDNELYVSKDVMKFLIKIFSIDDDKQVKPIIGNWFEEHNDLKSYKVIPWDFSDASDWKKVVRWETKKRLS
jgi:hypothetical protein